MDLLFRLGKKEGGFKDIEEAKTFFRKTIILRNNSYFYDVVSRGRNLNSGDNIYFTFDSYIVAKAIFTGEIKINHKRSKKYIHGHKLKNIEILDVSEKINNKIFGARTTYIDNKKGKEIERVLNSNTFIYPDEIPDDNLSIKEGAKKTVTVNIYERSSEARKKCLEKYGYLCFICSFDFENKFGDIGNNFIHVHHLKPLSEVDESYKVDPVKDLRPVCPNCHAMLHRKNPAYSIEEIKNKIIENDL